jgi:transposase-like protein
MKAKNRYRKWARLDNSITREIIKCFSLDLTATKTAEILWIERKTINDWYSFIRIAIYSYSNKEKAEKFDWIIELDESYFWPTRVRWKRWRWAWMKTIVFGLLKRDWKVYTEIIPDAKAKTLIPIIRWKVEAWSIINTDWWKAYDGLVDLWFDKHYRVHHWDNEFARWKQHINWIESFWSFTKRRLSKFNWIKKEFFQLHLKESEFRYNVVKSWWNLNYIIQQILIDFNK